MKFYDCATAPSPRRVRIFLAEKGLSIPTVQIDLRNGEQFTPAFRAINPDCTVPVLKGGSNLIKLPIPRAAAHSAGNRLKTGEKNAGATRFQDRLIGSIRRVQGQMNDHGSEHDET
jgi:Glutathione S-transferase, N-terminal domain